MGGVRQGDGVEEEEWLFDVGFDPLDHFVLDEFMGVGFVDVATVVAGEEDGLVVVVEIGGEIGVGEALAVVAEEAIHAFFGGSAGGVEKSHPPFAEGAGGLACGFGDLGDGDGFLGERELAFGRQFVVSADRAVSRARLEPSSLRMVSSVARASRRGRRVDSAGILLSPNASAKPVPGSLRKSSISS